MATGPARCFRCEVKRAGEIDGWVRVRGEERWDGMGWDDVGEWRKGLKIGVGLNGRGVEVEMEVEGEAKERREST